MKNNTLAAAYTEDKRIEAAFDQADLNNDEAGKTAARNAHKAFEDNLRAQGKAYCSAYRLYAEAQRRGNTLVDISEPIPANSLKDLLDTLRGNGIEEFTFSSTWSSAVEIAWFFTETGCALAGMTEINGACKNIWGDSFERVPAFLFRLN